MVCIYCGAETSVINSRLQKRANQVWRRRRCTACLAVFTTHEQLDYEKSWVVQYPAGRLAPFTRDKLFVSIYNSLRHRPTALSDAIGLSDTVINRTRPQAHGGLIAAADITKITYSVLSRFDKASAISYQAFHSEALSS